MVCVAIIYKSVWLAVIGEQGTILFDYYKQLNKEIHRLQSKIEEKETAHAKYRYIASLQFSVKYSVASI